MTEYVIDFNTTSDKNEASTCSPAPTNIEKELSKGLNEAFEEKYGDQYKKVGYQKVNFGVEVKKDTIVIKESFWIRDNGDIEIIDIGHKHRIKGHSISTRLKKKVSNLAMSFHLPTPFILFHQEIEATFKEGTSVKIIGASLLASIFALAGITPEQLLMGTGLFILIAFFDAVLGVMPNTKDSSDVKKEHTIQSKFWKFVANLLAMAALISIHLFTKNLVSEPNLLQYIPLNIHFLGIGYLLVNYGYSIFKYIAVANNSKVPIPEAITKHFKKEE